VVGEPRGRKKVIMVGHRGSRKAKLERSPVCKARADRKSFETRNEGKYRGKGDQKVDATGNRGGISHFCKTDDSGPGGG